MRKLGLTLLVGLTTALAGAQQPAPESPVASSPQQKQSHPVPKPPQKPAEQQQEEEPAATFKVNVKLVNVFTTVTDQNGAPIGGLKKEDFKIFEDGVQQNIAVFSRESALPLSIVLGLDASLSTRKDLPLEIESAKRFSRAILRPQDGLSVMQFSEIVKEVVPFTSDLRRIEQGITRIQTGSATALYDAIFLGSSALDKRQGRKVMVLITDGGDTLSQTSYHEALRAAQISETILYAIIMVPIEASAGRDLGGEHALIQMANDTGGKYYYATSINQLDQAFRQISEELRTQYLIAYYPPKKAYDEFRRIKVEVDPKAAGLPEEEQIHVSHRAGYFTGSIE
ncbi:MAG TPA: VWA domain-containing protein [Terriglobales bacterium]